ncbi:hypothetical protein FRC04_006461 [Tulasnella sp. 424]|nr:hypothetical protein FRC04_006461 [Tulasnella sp. 424]
MASYSTSTTPSTQTVRLRHQKDDGGNLADQGSSRYETPDRDIYVSSHLYMVYPPSFQSLSYAKSETIILLSSINSLFSAIFKNLSDVSHHSTFTTMGDAIHKAAAIAGAPFPASPSLPSPSPPHTSKHGPTRSTSPAEHFVPLSGAHLQQGNSGREAVQLHRPQPAYRIRPVHSFAPLRPPPPAYPAHHLNARFNLVGYGFYSIGNSGGGAVDVVPPPYTADPSGGGDGTPTSLVSLFSTWNDFDRCMPCVDELSRLSPSASSLPGTPPRCTFDLVGYGLYNIGNSGGGAIDVVLPPYSADSGGHGPASLVSL